MKPPNVKLELEVLGRALISFLLNYLPTFISLFIESHYKTVTTALIQEQCFSFLSLYLRDHPKIHFGIIPISRQQRDMARTYLQPHYGNGVFGNVYLSAGQH